jgi:hypothetical protein
MDIKKDGLYSIRETAEITKWSIRKLQRHAKKEDIKKIDKRYLFYGYQIEKILLSKAGLSDNVTTVTTNSTGGYDKNIAPMSVVEILENEIENLRNERDYLKEKYDTDVAELKKELYKDIPHQQKLKEAIQLITLEAMEQNVQHKVFTDEEYNDIIGTLSEVEFQTKQVEYLKSRVEKQDEILSSLTRQIQQRNYIEAKDKGFDKE